MRKKDILLVDSEGGHGGSSKSMLTLVNSIENKYLNLNVLCKKESWVRQVYKKRGIKCDIATFLPTYTVLDTIPKNLYSLFLSMLCLLINYL